MGKVFKRDKKIEPFDGERAVQQRDAPDAPSQPLSCTLNGGAGTTSDRRKRNVDSSR
jgi:hypothetical protein